MNVQKPLLSPRTLAPRIALAFFGLTLLALIMLRMFAHPHAGTSVPRPGLEPGSDRHRLTATMAGNWTAAQTKDHLIILPDGNFWSDHGQVQGEAVDNDQSDINLLLQGQGFVCSYQARISDDDLYLELRGQTGTRSCPSGHYTKPHAF